MKHYAAIALASFSIVSMPSHAAGADKKACAKGELGGIVVSNKREGDTYVTLIKDDKVPLRTPKNAGLVFNQVGKLKAGDLYCFPDDGS
jgi:hypothetical protein